MANPHARIRSTALLISALMLTALSGSINAQSAPSAAQQLGTVTITDVPANHWAREAVTLMVQKNLISGFPDGTFRGDQPLTRYQAALIFARVLRQDLSGLTPEERAVLQSGIDSVPEELALLKEQVILLSGLMTSFADDLNVVKSDRQTDQARTAQLEAALALLTDEVVKLGAANAELSAQAARERIAQAQAALGQSATPPPTPTAAQGDVAFVPSEAAVSIQDSKFALSVFGGLGGAGPALGGAVDYQITPALGAQVYAQTTLGKVRATALGLNAQYRFGTPAQDLRPYVLAGAGVAFGEGQTGNGSASDVFVRAGGGAEYRMADTLSLFGDAFVDAFFTNNSVATGRPFDAASGVGIGFGARVGAKFRF